MPNVKADERLVVVTHRPKQDKLVRIGIGAGLFLGAIAAYVIGVNVGLSSTADIIQERDQLIEQLQVLQIDLNQVRKEKVQVSVGAEIDRKAVEEVRLIIKALETEIADQEEEISFYKGLMAPSDRQHGLSVRNWSLFFNGEEGAYHFKLVVQQVALKHRVLKGVAKVNIIGDQHGQQVSKPLWSLLQQKEDKEIKLRFKYFQIIEGDLRLPVGFRPQRIEVVASVNGKKSSKVEETFEWKVGEG